MCFSTQTGRVPQCRVPDRDPTECSSCHMNLLECFQTQTRTWAKCGFNHRKFISSHLTSVNEWLKNKIKAAPCLLFFLLPSACSFLSLPLSFMISKQLPPFWPSYPHKTPPRARKAVCPFISHFIREETLFQKPLSRLSLHHVDQD